jgi:hypothetical protein
MFYEEKTINGVLCYRTQPDGDWIEFTAEEITKKLNDAMDDCLNLTLAYYELGKLYQKERNRVSYEPTL